MLGTLSLKWRNVYQFPTGLRLFNVGWVLNPVLVGFVLITQGTTREMVYSSTSVISTVLLGLILSESGLFVSMFWGALSTVFTSGLYVESMILPSPSLLVIPMTIILSAVSVSVSSQYLKSCGGSGSSTGMYASMVMVLLWVFCLMLVNEYLGLSFGFNDGALGTYMLMLTGLHFSHVVVGAVLLLLDIPPMVDIYSVHRVNCTEVGRASIHSRSSEPFVILYMHFIEAVWLTIQAIIYL